MISEGGVCLVRVGCVIGGSGVFDWLGWSV